MTTKNDSAIDSAIQKLLDLTSSLDSLDDTETRWGFDISMNAAELTKQAKALLIPLIEKEQQAAVKEALAKVRAELEKEFEDSIEYTQLEYDTRAEQTLKLLQQRIDAILLLHVWKGELHKLKGRLKGEKQI